MDEVGGPGGINPQHFQPAEKPAGIDTEIWGGAKSARRGTRPKMTRTLSMANLRGTIRAR